MIVYPHSLKSRSAKKIATALGWEIQKNNLANSNCTILNWGCGVPIKHPEPQNMLNKALRVKNAIVKYLAFEAFRDHGILCPEWTRKRSIAQQWSNENEIVFARTASHHGGRGIEIIHPGMEVPEADLYTKYIKKKKEFRVHVFRGNVIDVTEKRKKKGIDACQYVRSHSRGWVFCRKNLVEPDGLRDVAIAAVNALGLDFGAVDIIYNEFRNKLYVLEVNTAPGLEKTTLEAYKNAIQACEI